MRTISLCICLVILLAPHKSVMGQDKTTAINLSSLTDGTPPFYKWELGLNSLQLFSATASPADYFGYVLKRNFQKQTGRQAVRLQFLPQYSSSGIGNVFNTNQNVVNWSVNTAVGYEWQKIYGRFAVLYGPTVFFRVFHGRRADATNVFIATETNAGISGFIGGRYYLTKHLSLTLESHLVYNVYNATNTYLPNNYLVTETGPKYSGYFDPVHGLYIGYHF